MEYIKIGQKQIDLAGKYRVWSEIAEGEWLMTKWDYDPTEDEVRIETNRLIAVMEEPPPEPPEPPLPPEEP